MPSVSLTLNGERVEDVVPDRLLLADFLRERLRLTGVHVGCEHGVCGACTVLLNGAPVRSCLLLAAQVDASELVTVEGLDGLGGELAPTLRQAFHEQHALQCGFCTPGLLVTATELLRRRSGEELDASEVRTELAGNICRCTGYVNIVEAVLLASRRLLHGVEVG
jgi:aerobic-type carbon monoxide dehydrogenase small subunit (CoxS/CutS family)